MTPQKLNNGLLVILEGIDGAGKTTQLELASQALAQEGWPIETTRNLGGTPIGEELRKVIKSPIERPAASDMYISAAIQEALIENIKMKRQQGSLILMDRGPFSLVAYSVYGGGLSEDLGWPQTERGMQALSPELTIIYKTDVKEALKRIKNHEKSDYFESKPLDYFERVAIGYETAAKRYDDVVVIDANQPIEAVHKDTMDAIKRALDAHSAH